MSTGTVLSGIDVHVVLLEIHTILHYRPGSIAIRMRPNH